MYKHFFKKVFDFLIASILLILFFPLLVLISLTLILVNKGTPFFIQKRPGINEKPFLLIKFKTMIDVSEFNENYKNSDDGKLDIVRITKLGRFLRATSIDELPELINVLMGQMSLIGPRPLLLEYLNIYSDRHKRRHDVLPGITGLAQVRGRNSLSWKNKLDLDIKYIDQLSFLNDIKILFLTFMTVFKIKQVNKSKDETMSKLYEGYEI